MAAPTSHLIVRPLVLVALALAACSGDEARLRQTTKPTYDEATGKLKELTHDANGNGRIDTWMDMDGTRPIRARIDRDEDGVLDRWEYYGAAGKLVKIGFSRAANGRPDAWAYPGPEGRGIARVELSSTGDEGRVTRWEQYDPATGSDGAPGRLLEAAEDTNGDGRADKWERFERGALASVTLDENFDGSPDRRLTYRDGTLAFIESEPGADQRFTKRVPVR